MTERELAREMVAAYAARRTDVVPPSARGPWTLDQAYRTEAELMRLRQQDGRRTVGRKVGFANRAVWPTHGLETVVWGHMYDDTVQYAGGNNVATVRADTYIAPRLEPEIVFKLRGGLAGEGLTAGDALEAVEWLALGFEIIDCVYHDWQFRPVDLVSSYGLHAGLVVGTPRVFEPAAIGALLTQLAAFTLTLTRNGVTVADGGGRHVLGSPALCAAELGTAVSRRQGMAPLASGDLISTGSLAGVHPIASGDTFTATSSGLDLPPLTLHVI